MLADSQQYEAKRIEVENWLQRMETRLERMAAVGHTADVLEAQLREQKVHHNKHLLRYCSIILCILTLGTRSMVGRLTLVRRASVLLE